MDSAGYLKKLEESEKSYEMRCKRCGACCGATTSDPCLNLAKDASGKYYCRVYDHRIGQQHTVSGKTFTCIPIKDVLTYAQPCPGCGYAR